MKMACPSCNSSLDVSKIKQHCFSAHNFTDVLWRLFLRRHSQVLFDRLQNYPSKATFKRPKKELPPLARIMKSIKRAKNASSYVRFVPGGLPDTNRSKH